ncbi:MAG: fibronectin type III domain-containing protein [Acidobacteriota bacterium]
MSRRLALLALIFCTLIQLPARALAPSAPTPRFIGKSIDDPAAVLATAAIDTHSLSTEDALRRGWDQFSALNGAWSVQLDERTGLPLLATGQGLRWFPVAGRNGELVEPPTLELLEQRARQFLDSHPSLLGRWGDQLVLDRAASGPINERVWQVTFRQSIGGVAVSGARYDFHIEQGNLVAFGAYALGPVEIASTPTVSRDAARVALNNYLGDALPTNATFVDNGTLQLLPLDPRRDGRSAWTGSRGRGLAHALVWRFSLRIPDEAPTWIAQVDAHSGNVIGLYDDTRYEQIRGGVFPLSNDGVGPEGIEQPAFPMPFTDYTVAGGAVSYSGDEGLYSCSGTGATVRTTLNGKYIRVSDGCGPVDQTTTCDNPLEFLQGPGTDCAVPPGSSAGNTHAARSSFYHLNLAMAKGRAWLPTNTWLQSQVIDNVNINSVCNAYWDGTVNFYKSGGGCRNTGELQGVFVHEWGHGLDQNDGGGYDNTSEAYADVVAIFEARLSCVGRGFFESQNCGAYGDTCLNCTGIRDMNWNSRTRHQPATPANFVQQLCGGGGGPCGREVHCESYPPSEAIFDLATRDLVSAGLDADSAWQLAERLFYQSRQGSGGPIFNCSLPNSDGCGTNSWFHKLRLADDDDGNLANGTPHAKAIYDAFGRHNLACGLATDPTNQSSAACPALAKPVITQAQALTNAIVLSWNAVPGAAKYRVLRNDLGCGYAQLIVGTATAPTTTFTDDQLANGQSIYYRVQAIGSNSACESPVSTCVEAGPQPLAGAIRFDRDKYSCASTLGLRVVDANAGPGPLAVKVWSDSETQFETVQLTEVVAGTGKYQGSIAANSGPPVHGDNQLSVKHGDALHAEYIDANDGAGGTNVPRQALASTDCVAPLISAISVSDLSDTQATINWQTDEIADSSVVWGATRPPTSNQSLNTPTTQHAVTLTGLSACTVYWYRVGSSDTAGNAASADNGGQYYRFETYQDFGYGPEPCHGSTLTVDAPVVSCASALSFSLFDHDLNRNPGAIDSAVVQLTSSSERTAELVTVYESDIKQQLVLRFRATA